MASVDPSAVTTRGARSPSPEELAVAREAWTAAAGRLVADLPALRSSGILTHWSDETYELLRNGGPPMVEAAFDALEGHPDPMRGVVDLLTAHGRSRARTSLAASVHMHVAVLTRRELLDMTFDEVGEAIPFELKVLTYRLLGRVLDEALIANLSGYHDEMSVVAAENDDLATKALEVADMAFAHGEIGGTVAYANDTFSTFFSQSSRSGPVGRRWEDVLPETATALVQKAAEGQDCWRDLEVVDEYGTARLLRLSLHPAGTHLQALAIDVGDRIAYERQHAEFVRGLIHDLRAPLTLISGWSGLLATSGDELDEDTRAKALETINRAGRQLQDLTDNLLELVLIESGVHAFARDDVDVAALARSLGEIVTDVKIEAPDAAATAVADADAVGRVLANLVENARAHGSAPIVVSVASATESVRLCVSDAGECDADLVRAALQGRVRSTRGFGIGLRTSALIAGALGGSLELTSSDPTTFELVLPVSR